MIFVIRTIKFAKGVRFDENVLREVIFLSFLLSDLFAISYDLYCHSDALGEEENPP